MRLAREFIDEHDWTATRKLDYSIFENYWPNLAFLDVNYQSSQKRVSGA